MKPIWCLIASATLFPYSSYASEDCTNFAGGKYLVAGSLIDLDTFPGNATLQVLNGLTVNPSFSAFNKLFGSWNPYRPTIPRGYGCALSAPSVGITVCFTNNVVPVLPLQLHAGFSLVCCQTNGPATFEDIVGRAPDPGTKVYRQRPGGDLTPWIQYFNETNYYIYSFDGVAWTPEIPVADVHEAVWAYQPPITSNLQAGSGGFSFDMLTPNGGAVTVEYNDDLTITNGWSVLTNVPGPGPVVGVLDPEDATTVTQRFYRTSLHP